MQIAAAGNPNLDRGPGMWGLALAFPIHVLLQSFPGETETLGGGCKDIYIDQFLGSNSEVNGG